MKTISLLLLVLLGTTLTGAFAQAPASDTNVIVLTPGDPNRDALVRELLRRMIETNRQQTAPAPAPSIPMTAEPPGTGRALRTIPTRGEPAAPAPAPATATPAPVPVPALPVPTPSAPTAPAPSAPPAIPTLTLPAAPPALPPPVTPGVPAIPSPTAAQPPAVPVPALPAIPVPQLPLPPTATAQPVPPVTAQPVTPGAPGGPAPLPQVPAGMTAAPAVAGPPPVEEKLIEQGGIRMQNMPLDQVLEVYTELVNRTVLRPATVPQASITIRNQTPLTRTEAIQMLDSILSLNGITMVPMGEKFIVATQNQLAVSEAMRFSEVTAGELPEAAQYVTHIVQLQHTLPSQVLPVIQPFGKLQGGIVPIENSQVLVIRDFAVNVKRMLEVIEKVDIVAPLEIKFEIIPIKYALAGDIASVISSLTGTGGGVTTAGARSRAATTRFTPGGGAGGVGGAGAGGVSPFGQAQQFGQPQFGQQQFGGGVVGGVGGAGGLGAAGGTQSQFQQRLQQIVQRAATGASGIQILGEVNIIPDERTNALLIFANDADMRKIRDLIDKLDVVLAQVVIEGLVLEVSLDDTKNISVAAGQRPEESGNVRRGGVINNNQNILGTGNNFLNQMLASNDVSFLSQSGLGYFAQIGDKWDIAVVAAATDSAINVLSRPRVQTSHAVPASIFVGDTVPFVTGTITDIQGGTRSQFQNQRVGISLDVLPLVNPEGLVVMDITQNIQQLGNPTIIDGNPVPTTTERQATAKVAVNNRDTILLGGFITSTKTKSKSGVPYLKDLPVVGSLFRTTSDSTRRVELLVLIRPTVLPDPRDAAMFAREEREALPGVRMAERQFVDDYEAKQKRADKEIQEADAAKKKAAEREAARKHRYGR